MYTKEAYKSQIKTFIQERGYDPSEVAKRTFQLFTMHRHDIKDDLYEKLIDIFTMEAGPEFEMTEEEFKEFINNM